MSSPSCSHFTVLYTQILFYILWMFFFLSERLTAVADLQEAEEEIVEEEGMGGWCVRGLESALVRV